MLDARYPTNTTKNMVLKRVQMSKREIYILLKRKKIVAILNDIFIKIA